MEDARETKWRLVRSDFFHLQRAIPELWVHRWIFLPVKLLSLTNEIHQFCTAVYQFSYKHAPLLNASLIGRKLFFSLRKLLTFDSVFIL